MQPNSNSTPVDEFNNKSRSDWASLEWSKAQKMIGDLFSNLGYFEYQEFRLPRNKRADILVWHETNFESRYGIIEVKSYKRISQSIIEKAKKQIIKYFRLFVQEIGNKHINKRKSFRIFLALVFTKDYPGILNQKIEKINIEVDGQVVDADLLLCTPEKIILNLITLNFVDPKQTNIQKYFKTYS